jgi:hypothetical protein
VSLILTRRLCRSELGSSRVTEEVVRPLSCRLFCCKSIECGRFDWLTFFAATDNMVSLAELLIGDEECELSPPRSMGCLPD